MKIFLTAIIAMMAVSCAPTSRTLLSGDYYGESPTERLGEVRFVEVTIKPHKEQYWIEGSAGYSSGRAAAPDFEGGSTVSGNGKYEFLICDSFDNKGTATVIESDSGISIEINITKIMDARCLSLYGPIQLHKKANKSP
ncbi:hypothetical protein QQ054_21955 [Oscillatoria amoena NRMC-F 0135]|nr:hypothetical protein [Oscillatoria laete-virens]MDL5048681.1 hypothetical protein [Oscillatoria amoena NRMC-F 0135]MDL5053226.1 hypothetical protein [Oscillatoria laete-virens NRMC-F 0139]